MFRFALNIIALLGLFSAAAWKFFVEPHLTSLGYFRVIVEPRGNTNCKTVPDLQACEKTVLHQPTGRLYLACSTPYSRSQWTPALEFLNAEERSTEDYVAFYDPKTSLTTKLDFQNYHDDRGISLHGMDVVPSGIDPSQLWVYLVNHRPPRFGRAQEVGADSSVEIFKTTVGGSALTHIRTIESPVIITPNDVVGSDDGMSFYFTNDHGEKVGMKRTLDLVGRKSASVAYCHVDHGCHYAIQNLHGFNGIAKAPNGTIYVANSIKGGVNVLEEQADHSLILMDYIPSEGGVDNISVDLNGHVWGSAFHNSFKTVLEHYANPSVLAASRAMVFTVNTNPAEIPYGIKFKVNKIFEDDGNIASGTTSVVYDVERNRLFLSGLSSPHLTICQI